MKTLLLYALLVAPAAGAAAAQNSIAGDWQGTLEAGGASVRVVLHVTASGDGGGYSATMDSPDQGASGIPVSSISLAGSKLTFRVDKVNGSFEGQVADDGAKIDGTWMQSQRLPLTFERVARAPSAADPGMVKPSDVDGTWLGILNAGARLRIVFHIATTGAGLTATLDSPDQGGKGIPASAAARKGSTLTIEWKALAGKFEGKISPDLTAIEGTWTQRGNSLPLVLKRVQSGAELEQRRPQNPSRPYPYQDEDVTFENPAAGIRLAGTLTLPRGSARFPAVFLITGSGPQDRDESLMGHRPFLVLADYLSRRGFAVLRADDRGVGKSGGNFAASTTADFATDAEAALAYLKTRREVDPERMGFIGHSEGGEIAPMVAARNRDVAFVVMLAGPGVPGDEILVAQTLRLSESSGKSRAEAEKASAEERQILEAVKGARDDETLEKDLRGRLAGVVPDALIPATLEQIRSPWFRYFLTYDPAIALRRVRCPVLALIGEKDLQVSARQNLPAIRKALAAGGNRRFEAVELPGLNHLFQTARTGNIDEYGQIEETISPVALEKIAGWLTAVTRRAG